MKHWLKRYNTTQDVKRKQIPGRPLKTTPAETRNLIQTFKDNPFLTAYAFERSSSISAATIRKILAQNGIRNRVAANTTEMSLEVKQKRVIFCKEMLRAFPDGNGLERIIFSDEKTFSSDPVRKKRVYRPNKCRHQSKYVQSNRLLGSVNFNFWGAISFDGPIGDIVPVGPRFNSERYEQTLEECLLPYLESNKQQMFIQDNAPIHTSDTLDNWFQRNNIIPIVFPPYSPDLNIIEHVWPKMTRDWRRMEDRTSESLVQAVQGKWQEIKNDKSIYIVLQ